MRFSYIICSIVMFIGIARADASDCIKALSSDSSVDRAGKLRSLLANGLDMESETIGYHGTSVESLLIALETGFLPVGPKFVPGGGKIDVRILGLYFSPVATQLPKLFKGKHLKDTHSRAAEIASGYAGAIAKEIVFLKSLDIPFQQEKQETSHPSRWLADSLEVYQWRTFSFRQFLKDNAESINQFRLRRYVSDAELREAIKKSIGRKGVLLALSKSAMSKYKMIDVYPDEGIFVQTGEQGLPLDAIVGLEPLGQFEWDTISRRINAKEE